MAKAVDLSITTDNRPRIIEINGERFEMKSQQQLSFGLQRRLLKLAANLQELGNMDEDEEPPDYKERCERADRIMVQSMGELFVNFDEKTEEIVKGLSAVHRLAIVNTVFMQAALGVERPPKKATKRKASSRASKGSTAATRKTG